MSDSDNPKAAQLSPALKRQWLGPATVAAVFLFAIFSTWQKWAHQFVDSGIQFYIPWRLNHGAVLYRDLFYFAGGPFSQYFNALLFKIFGTSILTLAIFNLVCVAAMLAVIYRFLLLASNAWTATIACLGIIMVFAFGDAPNFNYETPYSHEALHGLIFSVFAIALLTKWVNRERLYFAVAAGFCAGIVFLTKPDIFVALTASVTVAFILFFKMRRRIRFIAESFAAFFSAALIPPLFFFFYFFRFENWRDSLNSVCFAWTAVRHDVLSNPLYQWCMGLEHPAFFISRMLIHFSLIVAVVVVYAFVLRHLPVLKSRMSRMPWLLWVLYSAPVLIWASLLRKNFIHWYNCAAAFPLLGLAGCILICWHYKKLAAARDATFPLLWSIFGLLMLSKMGLFSRVWEYGFILSMPVTVGIVYTFSWALPKFLNDRFQVPTLPMRVTAWLIFLIAFSAVFIKTEAHCLSWNFAVGKGGDRMVSGEGAWSAMYDGDGLPPDFPLGGSRITIREGLKETLDWIQTNVPPDGTLAVLPHGATVNYLSRRVNPTPCLFWDPNVAAIFGETNTISKFQQHPPDYIFLVEWYEYRVGYFGQDYGVELMRWIQQNYHPVELIGSEPFRNAAFGVKILKRNP